MPPACSVGHKVISYLLDIGLEVVALPPGLLWAEKEEGSFGSARKVLLAITRLQLERDSLARDVGHKTTWN